MWRNSLGQYTLNAVFVPAWYNTKREKFKPIEYKRIDCEITETETTKPICGTGHEAESGITPKDKQTTTQATE
jgi:hypothetical protein